jgi:carbamate kinase
VFKPDGDKWRRVVASPQPKRIFETRPITWLLERNAVVIASGGGGIPTTCDKSNPRTFVGAECVVDKDLALELLARELNADVFVMLTGADAVCVDFGAPSQRAIRRASPDALATFRFPAGTMGAKIEAACRFATATGRKAAIGAPADLEKILDGRAGTTISLAEEGLIFANDPAPASRAAVRT